MSIRLPRPLLFLFSCLTCTSVFYSGTNVEASESVVLKYRILREKISVSELSTFAETGELSSELRFYLNAAKRDPEELRRTLTREIEVNPILLSRMLNSIVGEAMLDQVSTVVYTPSKRASRQSLRSALLSSALPDGKITLIETLENYPTSEVYVDGDRLVKVYEYLNRVISLPFR